MSSVLEPGRPARTDKTAILADAIRVLTRLKTEAQELKETNENLLEEIKTLKVVISKNTEVWWHLFSKSSADNYYTVI